MLFDSVSNSFKLKPRNIYKYILSAQMFGIQCEDQLVLMQLYRVYPIFLLQVPNMSQLLIEPCRLKKKFKRSIDRR